MQPPKYTADLKDAKALLDEFVYVKNTGAQEPGTTVN